MDTMDQRNQPLVDVKTTNLMNQQRRKINDTVSKKTTKQTRRRTNGKETFRPFCDYVTRQQWLTPFQIQKICCIRLQKWTRQRLTARREPRVRQSTFIKRWWKHHAARRVRASLKITSSFQRYRTCKHLRIVKQFVLQSSTRARHVLLKKKSCVQIQTLIRYYFRRLETLKRNKTILNNFLETKENENICQLATKALYHNCGIMSLSDSYVLCKLIAKKIRSTQHIPTEALIELAIALLISSPHAVSSSGAALSVVLEKLQPKDISVLCKQLIERLTNKDTMEDLIRSPFERCAFASFAIHAACASSSVRGHLSASMVRRKTRYVIFLLNVHH